MAGNRDARSRLSKGNALFRKSVTPLLLAELSKKRQSFLAVLICSGSRISPERTFNRRKRSNALDLERYDG
ncbi:MAG: hypothetical protein A3K67_06270 [Euryarchaeota archaeon RBG_16_62_10]|nr:MAG: hypothetical protein A3K67_06270 [Euryarchaeota archaeon RBG_16_62_10]